MPFIIGGLEKALSNVLGREVVFEKVFGPMKPGDVPATYDSTDLLHRAVGFKPETSIDEGFGKFAEWYVGFYGVNKKQRRFNLYHFPFMVVLCQGFQYNGRSIKVNKIMVGHEITQLYPNN